MLFLAVTAGIVVGYVATVHAEMIIHRDIFHGRWAIVHRGPFKWLLYPHYVQHWKGHHTHAARHRDDLERGDRVPDSAHKVVETKYDNQWNVQYGLRCTDHGITIKGAECFTHYLLLFLLTPQPYLAGLLWFVLGPIAGIPAAIMPLATAVLHRNHRYFHMSIEARRKHAPWWQRWYVLSAVFTRVADEHLKHHYDSRFYNDYYVLLPFGNRILRLLARTSRSSDISRTRTKRESLTPRTFSDRKRLDRTVGSK